MLIISWSNQEHPTNNFGARHSWVELVVSSWPCDIFASHATKQLIGWKNNSITFCPIPATELTFPTTKESSFPKTIDKTFLLPDLQAMHSHKLSKKFPIQQVTKQRRAPWYSSLSLRSLGLCRVVVWNSHFSRAPVPTRPFQHQQPLRRSNWHKEIKNQCEL